MARHLSEIRERRRNKAREINTQQAIETTPQNNTEIENKNQARKDLEEILNTPTTRWEKFRKLFSIKGSGQKNKELKYQASSTNFKPIIFSLYIVIFFGLIIACFIYILKQESKYETKNKKLLTTPTKTAPKEEEKKDTSPLILSADEESNAKNTIENNSKQNFSFIADNETYLIESSIPNNIKEKTLDLGSFLKFIASSRKDFCKFAEQSRMAYIFANGELREYSYTTYPLSNNKLDYTNCMSTSVWKESDLFSLYQNLYDDFINTQNDDNDLLQKLISAKNYRMNVNFNPVRDFPKSLIGALLSEDEFSQLLSTSYMNQILLCDYSQKFAKSYDMFVSKRSGSLKPITNCYSENMNMQEAYVQYVFYYNYIQQDSKDINANLLRTALIPNYPK